MTDTDTDAVAGATDPYHRIRTGDRRDPVAHRASGRSFSRAAPDSVHFFSVAPVFTAPRSAAFTNNAW